MRLEDIKSVYFIGIGGIGMSAIARWFKQRNISVAGYDRTKTSLSDKLGDEGIQIHFEENIDLIGEEFKVQESTLVVYTPAVPDKHLELKYFQKMEFTVIKRSEVLGMISRGHFTIAIAGTHGKTTTSSMVAHIFNQTEKGCSAFVGGIMTNYNTNMIYGEEDAPVVVEADEFDRSFHRLSPNYAVVTSVDPDHLDIYGTTEEIQLAFGEFVKKTSEDGHVLIHYKAAEKINNFFENRYYTYGIDAGDYQAKALRAANGIYYFNYHGKEVIKDLKLMVPGFHNVENAVAAITVALDLGISGSAIKEAIASYAGVKRRFEYIIKDEKMVYIDDYAHHPTEITSFLKSVKSLYPEKTITAVFQPHLFSRTNDFHIDFAESLELADDILLMDIYPARELPMEGVTSEIILDRIKKASKAIVPRDQLISILDNKSVEVLVTLGAGDIDKEIEGLKAHFIQKHGIEA
ncbi:MAG: UDP-N-acetylmuramate--L-alanine ligase [Cyclobacteriaceae bacterium]